MTEVVGNIDILMISETKIDETFPTDQFIFRGSHTRFMLIASLNGGLILVYIWENVSAKVLSFPCMSDDRKCLEIEIKLRKENSFRYFCKILIEQYLKTPKKSM